ncbi:hypothetical protein DRQ20_03350 [bacterium]|nr:MAG: hypothetical protein DRQ20_03350 [bacterium]
MPNLWGISTTLVKDRKPDFSIFSGMNIELRLDNISWDRMETVKELKKILKRHSINVPAVHEPPGINISSDDEWERVKSIREVEKAILFAHHLKIKRLILHAPERKDSLEEIMEFGKEWGVEVVLENTSKGKGKDASYIFSLGLPVCLDTCHANKNLLEWLGHEEKIVHVHVSDTKGGEEEHLLPGEGNIPWKDVIPILAKRERVYIFELMPHPEPCKRMDEIKKVVEKWEREYGLSFF